MLSKLTIILLGIIIFAHSLILTKLFFFPYPELFVYPYLTNHGLKPYYEILDQHFPGLMFFPINLDNLGMNTAEDARILLIALVILTHVLLFLIGKKVFKSEGKALLVNFLYLVWQPFFEGWVFWIDNFLPLLLLPAFYTLLKRKIFLAGILMGCAIVFKQVLIPLALIISIYLWWESKKIKVIINYISGLFIPILLMVIYLISIGVFNDFIYWAIIFNLTIYAKFGRGMVPDLAHLSRVVLVFGTAFIILRKIKERITQLLIIFLIGSLIGLSTRFDFVHFQPALPFAIFATVFGLGKLEKWGRLGKILIASYVLIAVWWVNIFYRGHIGDKVFFFDSQTIEIANKIKEYTNMGDKIFVLGAPPILYQMTKTIPAGNIFVFQFPWFLKVVEDRILEGIIMDKPDIVVSDRTVKIEDQPITEFAKEIDKYIQENYEVIDRVGITTILRRKTH